MTYRNLPGPLVSADWLQQHLDDEDLVIFDASWHMPATRRDGAEEWSQCHIPGARFFDFDRRVCDQNATLPHMLPDENSFSSEMQALGLNQDSSVVIYDSLGMFSSPRVWWMLRTMGFDNAAVLDGGLPAWQACGYAVESARESGDHPRGNFVAHYRANLVADAQQVLSAIDDTGTAIIDARPAARFRGETNEPRPGLRGGHMPGADNLPFTELFQDGLLKPMTELDSIFTELIGERQRAICSCGSGVTACVIAFAAHRAGFEDFVVYDGSWCEWGLPGDLPVVTG